MELYKGQNLDFELGYTLKDDEIGIFKLKKLFRNYRNINRLKKSCPPFCSQKQKPP